MTARHPDRFIAMAGAWLVASLLVAAALLAQTPAAPPAPPAPTPAPRTAAPAAEPTPPATVNEAASEAPPNQPAPTPTPSPDLLAGPPPTPREPWLKRFRQWTHATVTDTAAWFDGLFGNQQIDDDVYVTRGFLTGSLDWDEEDGLEPHLRLRARFVFPQMQRKLGLLIGRGDTDEMLTNAESSSSVHRAPASESDTLAGLEYVPMQGTGSRLSFSGGLRIADPIEPIVRARYRYLIPLGDDNLLRLRQTVFWRETKGFGTTSAADLERRGPHGFLARLTVAATVSEVSQDVEFDNSLTFFHSIGTRSALAYRGWVEGETGADVPTREYGVDVAYRRRLKWSWLVGEIHTGRAWRRERIEDERHGVWIAGIGLEMQLGPTP